LERREPCQHSLLDPGKPRNTCVEMAGRRTFRILTYSQLSGIKVKAVIRPKYNLHIVMIQCTHYKYYYTFKAYNDNTHRTEQYTQIQLNLQLVIKIFYIRLILVFFPLRIAFTLSPQPITFRLFTKRVSASHSAHFDYLTLHHAYTFLHFTTLDDRHCTPPSSLHYTVVTAPRLLAFTSLYVTTLHYLAC